MKVVWKRGDNSSLETEGTEEGWTEELRSMTVPTPLSSVPAAAHSVAVMRVGRQADWETVR